MHWLLALVVLLLIVGCRGDAGPSAEERAVRRVADEMLTHVLAGRYGQAWESLHPVHQAIVSREQLEACGNRFPPVFSSHEIAEVSELELNLDEIGQTDGWMAVVVFELTDEFKAQENASGPIDRSLYVTQVDGDWRWVLQQGRLEAFRNGNCGIPWPGA